MRHQAIRNVYANAITIDGDSDVWDADGNVVAIDQSLVDAEVARLQAEWDACQYQRDRAAAYAPLGDQMDMQYWDALNSTTTWVDHVKDIKKSYPK